jgi:hypothetical protein
MSVTFGPTRRAVPTISVSLISILFYPMELLGLTVAHAEGEMLLSPPSTDRMQITCTNTARQNLDVNIVIAKRLWLEVVEVELSPFLRVLNLEAFERVWINHFDLNIPRNSSVNLTKSLNGSLKRREQEDRRERKLKKRRNCPRDLMIETHSGNNDSIGWALATTPLHGGVEFLLWIAVRRQGCLFIRMGRRV